MTPPTTPHPTAQPSEGRASWQEIGQAIRQQRLRRIRLSPQPAETGRRPDMPAPPAGPGAPSDPAAVFGGAVPGAAADWLGCARGALAVSDYHTAVYAAGVARHRQRDAPQVWSILARADAGLGRLADALVEAQRAVRLQPHDAEHHLTLAGIFEELGNWDAALQCYGHAERLAPDCDTARLGTAAVLTRTGDLDRALEILGPMYERGPDRSTVGDHLSLALAEAAERVPRVRDDRTYLVTDRREIARMRTLLRRAADVTGDPQLRADVAGIRRYVDRCARRELLPRGRSGRARLAAVVVVVALAAAVLMAGRGPVPLLLTAGGAGVLGIVGLVRHVCVPRWKLNRRTYERARRQAVGPPG